MPKLTEKQLLWVTIGVFALLTAGIGFFAWWLYNGSYQEHLVKRDALKGEIEVLGRQLVELNGWKIEIEELKKKEVEYADLLPSAEDVTRGAFINMLAGFEQQASVQVSELTEKAGVAAPAGPAGPGGVAKVALPFDTVEFKFTVKGGFYEVVQFMYLLESNKRLMKITEGDIAPDTTAAAPSGPGVDESPKKTPVTLSISVATYVYNQPKPPAPPVPPGGGGTGK